MYNKYQICIEIVLENTSQIIIFKVFLNFILNFTAIKCIWIIYVPCFSFKVFAMKLFLN